MNARWVFVLLVGGVASCGSTLPPLESDFSVTLSKDSMHFVPSSLESTADQFFRAPAPVPAQMAAAPHAGASAPLVDIDKDTLSSDSDTPYSEETSHSIQLRAGVEQPLSNHVSLVGGASISRGYSRYLLPQGAGVLVDPITIDFRTTGLELDAGIAVTAGKRVDSRLEFGVGETMTHTKTRINSALLNVANSSSHSAEFIYTRAQLSLIPGKSGQPEVRLKGQAKYYPGIGVSIQTGLALGF